MQNEVSQPHGVADHVGVAAEAVRAAIHAGYDDPGSDAERIAGLYRAVGEANLLLERLPELFRHLSSSAERLADLDGLDTDDTISDTGPDMAAAAAVALRAVVADLTALRDIDREHRTADAHNRLATLKLSSTPAAT